MLKQFCFLGMLCSISLVSFSQEAFYGNGNFYIFPGAEMGVFGDLGNDGNFVSSGGTVYFVGSTLQNITGASPVNINDLILNNSNNIKLDNQLEIIDVLTFTNGKVITDRSDYASQFVNFLAGSSYSGVDNTKFVDGVVRKTGNTAFVFPVGQYSDWQAISIDAPSGATDSYTAYYNWTDPLNDSFDPLTFQAGINNVSRCEYWILNPTSGSPDITFSLNFDLNSCGITDPADLIVVRWTGTEWENLGNGGTSGTVDDGIIIKGVTCSGCGVFNPITLGSLTSANPLPVELISFSGICEGDSKTIHWSTASEKDAWYFQPEYSTDGEIWVKGDKIPAAGNSNSLLNYEWILDNRAELVYVRLQQVDIDGTVKTYGPIQVSCIASQELILFPNPTRDQFSLVYSAKASGNAMFVKMTDMMGKTVQQSSFIGHQGSNLQQFEAPYAPGVYMVELFEEGKLVGRKQLVKN